MGIVIKFIGYVKSLNSFFDDISSYDV